MRPGEEMTTVPATQPPAPDVKRPKGRIPEWVYWVSAVVAVGIFGGWAYWMKMKGAVKAPQTIVQSSSIPDDFFLAAPPPEPPKPPPAPEPKPAPAKPPMVEVPPTRIPAQQLFSPPPAASAPQAPPPPDPIVEFNDKRRGALSAMVARAGRIQEVSDWINSQTSWDDEERTEASFPVDMSRVITVNKNITAILKNAVNSEIEGKIVAVVEENIYCSHSRNICIPAGSEAVGRYKTLKKPGDERIQAFWVRIITPDGINIKLEDGELADAMGRTGITGDVDNRFMDRYGMALLVSTLSAATTYAMPVQNQGQQVVIQTYGSNLANLSSQILDKNINLKPKLDIPAGQRIQISPTKDIWFPKPERQSIEAMALDSLRASLPRRGAKR